MNMDPDTLPINFPDPEHNPNCVCHGNPMAAFWCQFGHMTECHHPYTCTQAACSHLEKYDFDQASIEDLRRAAWAKLREGNLQPYTVESIQAEQARLLGEIMEQNPSIRDLIEKLKKQEPK